MTFTHSKPDQPIAPTPQDYDAMLRKVSATLEWAIAAEREGKISQRNLQELVRLLTYAARLLKSRHCFTCDAKLNPDGSCPTDTCNDEWEQKPRPALSGQGGE